MSSALMPLREILDIRQSKLAEELYDYDLPNQKEAISMFKRHLLLGSKFGVHKDVDADGIAAGKLMCETLNELETEYEIFINPGKIHGLTDAMVAEVIAKEIEFLVIVDSSSSDIKQIRDLNRAGIDVLILDHHPIEGNDDFLSPNHVIVNVVNGGNSKLSAGAVVFKFLQKLKKSLGMAYENEERHMAWAGLTILSDVCSLEDPENRYLVRKLYQTWRSEQLFGLPVYYGSPRSLFSFDVIPMINAQIRMNAPQNAIRLALSKSKKELSDVWELASAVRQQSREIVEHEVANANLSVGNTLIVAQITNQNLSGLIANRLVRDHNKPVIAIYKDGNGGYAGSFRGPGNHAYLQYMQSRGVWAKGHEAACGIKFSPDDLPKLHDIYQNFPYFEPDTEIILEGYSDKEYFLNFKEMAAFNEMADHNLKPYLIKVHLNSPRTISYNSRLKVIQDGPWEIKDFTEKPLNSPVVYVKPMLDNSILGYQLLRDR